MLSFLAFIVGIGIPLLLGWITLVIFENNARVLGRHERLFFALILGPTEFSLIAFLSHVLSITSLNLFGFLIPNLLVLALLAVASMNTGALRNRQDFREYAGSPPSSAKADFGRAGMPLPNTQLPKWQKIGILLLAVWTAVKLLAGAYDLVSVPTYWDDSFNNWNMRGKMFFVAKKIMLEIPVGNGVIQSAGGVSSYPPTVPMLKTWLSDIRGSWQEPLVNGLHLIWITGLLGSFYFALRRILSPLPSLFGLYLLVSLPLLLIQAMNPYADLFMASCLFLPILCLYFGAQETHDDKFRSWMRLFGLSLGLLFFTKNEATALYAPLLSLLLLWVLHARMRSQRLDRRSMMRILGTTTLIALLLALPWLGFKFANGLTFGNAKSVSDLGYSLNTKVIQAIWFHLSHEPNWLLLPLVLPVLLILTGKELFRMPEGVLCAFLCTAMLAQFSIFIVVSSLATEAIMQTGLSRGLLHLAPIAMLLACVMTRNLLNEAR